MSLHFPSRRAAVALGALLFLAQASAQANDTLAPVVVTGNPLRNSQADAWAQRLSGDELAARRSATLGATLDGLPGVAASGFGPHASRPILRGLDGDRLRILANGGAVFDAASLSPDHAVALDPLVVEAIELVRGPAALLYGGNALGGVVNALDNRVPKGTRGAAVETRLGGAALERQFSAVLDGGPDAGAAGLAWHLDLSRRLGEAQRSPRFEHEGQSYRTLRNSDGSQRSAAVGASWVARQGFAGLSVDDFHAEYGVTAEPDVRLRMQRQRLGHEGEWRFEAGPWRGLRWQAARTRYAHDEVGGSGEVGTRFRLRGSDARLELEQRPLGPLRGVLGLQWESQRFAALGDEAFVPSTQSRHQALFLFEQWQQSAWTWGAGARSERVTQSSAGDAPGEERFGGAQTRRFTPHNLALQAAWQWTPAWRLQAQATRAERAPTHYELFAKGLHLATAAFERGDPALGLERAQAQELALVYAQAGRRLQLNLHRQRFARFIALQGTGETIQQEGEEIPVFAFSPVPARLQGFELQASQRLVWDGFELRLSGSLERLRGSNSASGEALPRLAPQRVQLGLLALRGNWQFSLDWKQVARQDRFSADDRATPGYRWWDLGLGHGFKWAGQELQVSLKAQNLGNALAYNASTMATLRGLAPLPGRNLQLRLGLSL